MPSSALVVFARAAVAGTVKTRLVATTPAKDPADWSQQLTADQATALHCAFVADTLDKGQQAGFPRRRLYVAGALDHPTLANLGQQHGYQLCPQSSGDLGARMDAAITAEQAAGASSVVLIGSDSPTLPLAYLRRAADWLAGAADLVLGPAGDGGYYLVGSRRPTPELFAPGIAWGTSSVLATTLERLASLRRAGLRIALLPLFYDCDTPADLRLLAAHLALGPGGAATVDDSLETSLDDRSAPRTAALLQTLRRSAAAAARPEPPPPDKKAR